MTKQLTQSAAVSPEHARVATPAGILQRKCLTCGTHTPGGGQCYAHHPGEVGLQRKLSIGSIGDPLEIEADHVANQVMAAPNATGKAQVAPFIQRSPSHSGPTGEKVPESVEAVLAEAGRPLESPVREHMEHRFGRDFSQVRIHDGGAAATSARDVAAQAYTAGPHVVFGAGRFAPSTETGRHLLAHELTHTIQQGQAPGLIQRAPDAGAPPAPPARAPGAAAPPAPGAPRAPAAPAAPAVPLSVDRIDVITSATGATSGYPAITSGDLNVPGPWNSTTTGGVSNIHQIHFHLDNGNSSALVPTRTARATFNFGGSILKFPGDQIMPPGVSGPPAPGGYGGVMDHLDGPAAHETKRPSTDTIVVADAPGAPALTASRVPFTLDSQFVLKMSNASGADIASIKYDVHISKTSLTNVPNATNSVTSLEKKDLVRGRAL